MPSDAKQASTTSDDEIPMSLIGSILNTFPGNINFNKHHMHRKHRSKPRSIPKNEPVLIDSVQTEVNISRKHLSKLVFHESDGGSSSDGELKNINFASSRPIRLNNNLPSKPIK